jgi:hypothetical protein
LAEISNRQRDKRQKKEDKERRKIKKVLRATPIDDLKDKVEAEFLEDVVEIISGRAVRRYLLHWWFDKDTKTYDAYLGKLEKVKHNLYVVAYWSPKETYQDVEKNLTCDFIDAMPEEHRERVINWAISAGRRKRHWSRRRQRKVEMETSGRETD